MDEFWKSHRSANSARVGYVFVSQIISQQASTLGLKAVRLCSIKARYCSIYVLCNKARDIPASLANSLELISFDEHFTFSSTARTRSIVGVVLAFKRSIQSLKECCSVARLIPASFARRLHLQVSPDCSIRSHAACKRALPNFLLCSWSRSLQ